MTKGSWKTQRLAGVLGLLLGCLAVGPVPDARAGTAAQGGEIGSGESGQAIDTTIVNTAAISVANGTPVGKNNVLPAGTLLLGFKLISLAANANCDLYDATTVVGAADSTVIDELAENTANGTAIHLWPNPYRVTTGVSVGARNAVCILYHR